MRSVNVKRLLELAVAFKIESRVWEPDGERERDKMGSGFGDGGKRRALVSFRRNVALLAVGRREDWMMWDVGV